LIGWIIEWRYALKAEESMMESVLENGAAAQVI
jgi:hypothetical protein